MRQGGAGRRYLPGRLYDQQDGIARIRNASNLSSFWLHEPSGRQPMAFLTKRN
jgi:hypothetical protein